MTKQKTMVCVRSSVNENPASNFNEWANSLRDQQNDFEKAFPELPVLIDDFDRAFKDFKASIRKARTI